MKSIEGLTELENKVLNFICLELATWREDEPGYSCVDGSDVTRHFKWPGKITSGVISSLTQKGYVTGYQFNKGESVILYPQWSKIPDDFGRVEPDEFDNPMTNPEGT